MNPFSHYFLAQHPDSFRNLNESKKPLPPGLFEGFKKEEVSGPKKSDERTGERIAEICRGGGKSGFGEGVGGGRNVAGIGGGGERGGGLEGFSTMMHIFTGKKIEKGKEIVGAEGRRRRRKRRKH